MWRFSHVAKAVRNPAGTCPLVALQVVPSGNAQSLDGRPAALDFVLKYSIHQRVFPRAATVQNKLTNTPARLDGEMPFTSAATAALLSTHKTQVLGCSPLHPMAVYTVKIDAQSSYMNIGDSFSHDYASLQNRSGKWVCASWRDSP